MLHFWAMHGFVAFPVSLTLFLDNPFGKGKFHFSVEHPSFVVRALTCIIALEGGEFIAKELRLFRSRMGNERFGLREFQFELFVQEYPNVSLNLFCFLFGANEPYEPIISVPAIPESSILWAVRV